MPASFYERNVPQEEASRVNATTSYGVDYTDLVFLHLKFRRSFFPVFL